MTFKKYWKMPFEKWMMSQRSINNTNNNMNHKNISASLRSLLSESFDRVLVNSHFHAPDILKGTIAAYLDTVQYAHEVAFRFPDIEEEQLMDRMYGLGLYLENLGLMNVSLNPNHSAIAQFGIAIQETVKTTDSDAAYSYEFIEDIRRNLKSVETDNGAFGVVAREFLVSLTQQDHGWLAQTVDNWEIDVNLRKFHSSYMEPGDTKRIELELASAGELMLKVVRQHVTPERDISTFLSGVYRPLYCVHSNTADVTYPDDLIEPLTRCKSPLVDPEKVMKLIYSLVLEDRLSQRNLRPGFREAPELRPLRLLLMGQKVFKPGTDNKELVEKAFEEGKALLKGQPETLMKTLERSYEEVSGLLLEGKIDDSLMGDRKQAVRLAG